MKIFKKILPFISIAIATFPLFANADCGGCNAQTGLCNPLGYCDIQTFLQKLLQVVAEIGFPVIVLFVVYVGFLFISAEGNPDKLKKARSYFLWVIVGALIVLGAQALSYAIKGTVNDLQQGL